MRALARRLGLVDYLGLTGLGFVIVMPAIVAGLVVLIGVSVTLGSRSVGRTTCRHWSEQTGYPSKFVILNFFDGGTCLARTPSGRWVKNTLVLTFTPRKEAP